MTPPNEVRVEQAENPMIRFPGADEPGETRENAEDREDARLLASIAGGNSQAVAALYRRRGTVLYSLLLRMLVSEMEAQEVLQDVFVRVWRRAHTFDPRRASPLAWMILVARGLAMDRLRARARRNAATAAYEQEVASLVVEEVARTSERDDLACACANAMRALPEPQARAVQLAFLRGWTHEEIALAEGEALGTIKSRIRRGLLALRQALKEYYG
jgi:RNA polymerase sigma-70 factor (ECF subfamily)